MQNNDKNVAHYVWWMFAPLIIIVVLQNLIDFFAMELLIVWNLATYKSGTFLELMNSWLQQATSPAFLTWVYVVYAVAAAAIFLYLYRKSFTTNGPEVWHNPFKGIADNVPLMLLGCLLFIIGMYYVSDMLLESMAMVNTQWLTDYEATLSQMDFSSPVAALCIVIFAPIAEETALRGICFASARKIMPAGWAIAMQALLFGALHMNMLQSAYAFVLGLGLGYVMYRYNNLLVVIILHMGFNLVGSLGAAYIPVPDGSNPIIWFLWLLGALVVTYGAILLLKHSAPGVKVSD